MESVESKKRRVLKPQKAFLDMYPKTDSKTGRQYGWFDGTHRYLVYYGGRGSGKSYAVAQNIVFKILFSTEKRFVLCAREIQATIEYSSKKQIIDVIEDMGFAHEFEYTLSEIRCLKNDSVIIFKGIKNDSAGIKSMSGVDICWVEEAENVSASSWKDLIPTIRKENSEIIVTFNPGLESSYTYQKFVANAHLLPKAIVKKVNWQQNEFFPESLRMEMEADRKRSEDDYQHIWEGNPIQILNGSVYSNEIRVMRADQRLGYFPVNKHHPVFTAWDLGWADDTSIVFFQLIEGKIMVVNGYTSSLKQQADYANIVNSFAEEHGIKYGAHYLPHDANQRNKDNDGMPYSVRLKRYLSDEIIVIPRTRSINEDIDIVREKFAIMYINQQSCKEEIGRAHV